MSYHSKEMRALKSNLAYLRKLYAAERSMGESRCLDTIEQQIQGVEKQIQDLEADMADKQASIKYGF